MTPEEENELVLITTEDEIPVPGSVYIKTCDGCDKSHRVITKNKAQYTGFVHTRKTYGNVTNLNILYTTFGCADAIVPETCINNKILFKFGPLKEIEDIKSERKLSKVE